MTIEALRLETKAELEILVSALEARLLDCRKREVGGEDVKTERAHVLSLIARFNVLRSAKP